MMPRGRWGPSVCLMCPAAYVVTADVSPVRAHGSGSEARYVEVVSWPQEHVARAGGRADRRRRNPEIARRGR